MSGCILSARWVAKLTWLDSIIFGVLMNTKGLVALISLNLGLSAKIISAKLFTMCVIMVIFNTIITGPLVNLIYRAFKRTSMKEDQVRR
jgi:Kef-type K+ transport system membrane component KefB